MKYDECCCCTPDIPNGHTRGTDWNLEGSRPIADTREEYAQADKITNKQINESGLVSRSPL